MRAYLAVLITVVVGGAIGLVLVVVTRLVRPDAELVVRDRLPAWWKRLTAWARSRSLRVWCPHPDTAARLAAHLQTDDGRRLSRLGVSLAEGPWAADVLVVERAHESLLAATRAHAPEPVGSVVLTDAGDPVELRDALVALAAALRWPADGHDQPGRGDPEVPPERSAPDSRTGRGNP